MNKISLAISTILLSFILTAPALGKNRDDDTGPWEKFGINIGVFIADADSKVLIGSSVAFDLDPEKILGLDSTNAIFRIDALWRFSNNRRHRLDLSWFAFRRSGERTLTKDIIIESPEGEQIIINAGTQVSSTFDFDIYQLKYSYSFFQDNRIDLAASLGTFVMPIDFDIQASGLADKEGNISFTAPLPAFGLRMDFAITPKWIIRSGTQFFYLKYQSFEGRLLTFQGAVEYVPWKNFGFGLGFDTFAMDLESENEDWPGVDLRGSVGFRYTGLQLYMRYFF